MDSKMDFFNKEWEVEYICAKVRDISHAVENGNYEHALDMLSMIQSKAKVAEHTIKNQSWNKSEILSLFDETEKKEISNRILERIKERKDNKDEKYNKR